MIPGEYFLESDDLELNKSRLSVRIRVDNLGDRPIQVGSHAHFFEVNRALRFDRERAYGFRLNIPAGTALRFEPGQGREVGLVEVGGRRHVYGMNGLVNGCLEKKRRETLDEVKE